MSGKKKLLDYSMLVFLAVVILLLSAKTIVPQIKSRIVGTVKDAETGEALAGASVIVMDTKLGAATDMNGKYFIINVPVGTYKLQAQMLSYASQMVVDVLVSPDRVTTVNFELTPTRIQSQEVVVTAERNSLHKEVSGTQLVVTEDQIVNTAGIREINAFLEKQPGVSSRDGYLEIRGGSADQTGTLVNGLSFNNAAVGNAETSIPLSAVDQVSLLSGGFNAEYGNFRSGLINITTKSGTKNRYHGTITVSRNVPHQKRFGPAFNDVHSNALAPYLDPNISFYGTTEAFQNDPYTAQQMDKFDGWIKAAQGFNIGKEPKDQATAFDYYLLAAWMQMAIPDYKGLENLPQEVKNEIGYQPVSDEQRKLFNEHALKETGTDLNLDAGFGGPLPFFSSELGDATFYISNNSKEQYYIMPVTRRSDKTYVTLATIKSTPAEALSITLNGLWKRELGVSPIRPAFGDFPDSRTSSNELQDGSGGFMTIDNIKYYARNNNSESNYWYDEAIFPLLDQTSLMGGVDANYVISKYTFFDLTLGFLSIKDHSPTGDNRNNTVLTHFGPFPVTEMPYGKLQFAPNNRVTGIFGTDTISYNYPGNDALPGVPRRFRGKEGDLYDNVLTQSYQLKFDLVSQFGEHHYFKTGVEYNLIDIHHNLWEKWNNNAYNTYEYNYHRRPSQTGIYFQDQISYEQIIANLGVRFDYFYGGGGEWPSGDPFSTDAFINVPYRDLSSGPAADSFYTKLASGESLIWDYWEDYNKTHPGFLQPIKNFFTISPRIGVAFPVTQNAKFYFNYGHFRSNPPYYSMYLYRYRYTKNGLYDLSNPNLEPPKTVSYELGISYNFYDNYILTISGYAKDITGQQGDVNYNNAGNINYDSWANNNYQDIQGIEINLTKNDNSWLTGWINFNYMLKKSGLTGREIISDQTINDQTAGLYQGQETRTLPQPTFNANISFTTPYEWFSNRLVNSLLSEWRLTIFAEWSAGSYFNWYNPLSKTHDIPYLQWPDYSMVDLRLSKTFNLLGFNSTLFVDISNVFNLKVNLLYKRYAFNTLAGDDTKYLASLHLPLYNSPEFDDLRAKNPGLYIAGNDKIGDLRSSEKPYINDPNFTYWIYSQPRDIWFGLKIDF